MHIVLWRTLARAAIVMAFAAATLGASVSPWPTYSFDGRTNRPDGAGAAGTVLSRLLGYHYADKNSSMLFPDRPLCCDLEPFFRVERDIPSLEGLNVATMSFGQFSSHDLSLTPESLDSNPMPEACTALFRMQYVADSSPRDHINVVSSFMDLSQVYGSDDATSLALRTLVDGKLKTGPGNLPPRGCKSLGVEMSNPVHSVTHEQLFCMGDVRGNENIMLLVLHTVFLREHNRIAAQLKDDHPQWNDDNLFFKARAINTAQYQQIAFYEYSRVIMGNAKFDELIGEYSGYDASVRPEVAAEFSQGVIRFMHGQIPEVVLDLTTPSAPRLRSLSEFFFNPNEFAGRGVDAFLHGMLVYPSQEVDAAFAPTIIDFPHLLALDCLRVRDLGLASFEHARKHYGITSVVTDVPSKLELLNLYASSVSGTDLFTGGLAEEHEVGSSYGPVFNAIYGQTLSQLRAGDPFWFENPEYALLSLAERNAAKATTFAAVIRRNTGINPNLVPDNAFKMPFLSANTAAAARTTNGETTTTGDSGDAHEYMGHGTPSVSKQNLRYLRAITGISSAVLVVLLGSVVVLAALLRRLLPSHLVRTTSGRDEVLDLVEVGYRDATSDG